MFHPFLQFYHFSLILSKFNFRSLHHPKLYKTRHLTSTQHILSKSICSCHFHFKNGILIRRRTTGCPKKLNKAMTSEPACWQILLLEYYDNRDGRFAIGKESICATWTKEEMWDNRNSPLQSVNIKGPSNDFVNEVNDKT